MTINIGHMVGYEFLIGVVKSLVIYSVLTFGQRLLRRFAMVRSIAVALNLAIFCGSFLLGMGESLAAVHPSLLDTVLAAWLFFMACVILRVLDAFVFGLINRWRQSESIPVVLRDIGRWLLSLVVLFVIIRLFFPAVNFNILALSSIVVGYIVGNATQDTLGNLIAGLALNTESPFHIGDWVMVGGHTGMVVDMTWRATRLWTKSDDYIMIPNSVISKEPIVNYSRPTQNHGLYLQVGVDYRVPPNKVREVILHTLGEIDGVLQNPPPEVRLTNFGDFSITYTIKLFLVDFMHLESVESNVMNRLWYSFSREGITIPFPIRDVRLHTSTPENECREKERRLEGIQVVLQTTDIFAGLPLPEVQYLAAHMREALYAKGEVLVRQGDEGDSLYLVRHGHVTVRVTDNARRETVVATLTNGAFFGEMSLLTGARRTATVVAECDTEVLILSHEVIATVLSHNASLAELLADTLTKRNQDRQAKIDATRDGDLAGTPMSGTGVLLQKIRAFFGLSAKAPSSGKALNSTTHDNRP